MFALLPGEEINNYMCVPVNKFAKALFVGSMNGHDNLWLGIYIPFITVFALAIAAVDALGLDFAGVDIMFGPDNIPIVCEVNSNPHFKSTLDCTGINLAEYIIKCIIRELR